MSLLRSRISKTLIAALMALVGVFTVSVPANAYVTPLAGIVQGSFSVTGAITWTKQADGTGVTVNWAGYTVNNCSLIGASGSSKWFNVHIRIYDGNTGAFVNGTDLPDTNVCNPTWYSNQNGLDEGFVSVTVMAAARRTNTNGNYWYEYRWLLYPSGNSVLAYSGWANY